MAFSQIALKALRLLVQMILIRKHSKENNKLKFNINNLIPFQTILNGEFLLNMSFQESNTFLWLSQCKTKR